MVMEQLPYRFDDVFSQFFDPVSEHRHGGFPASLPYGENLQVRMTTELPVRHFIVIPRCVDVAAQYQTAVFRHHAFRFFTVFRHHCVSTLEDVPYFYIVFFHNLL